VVPVTAKKGHVFIEEGENMTKILIIEEGTLVRTKLSLHDDDKATADVKDLSASMQLVDLSVTVDQLEGRGRVSGLLHTFKTSETPAFATVSVSSDTAKVWILDAEDFRSVVSTVPQHCLDVLGALARELREGSKSLRGLMQQVQKTNRGSGGKDASKNMLSVLCYDTTSWVSDGFQPAIAAFNEQQKMEHGEDAMEIDMHFTSERLSEESATYAAGHHAVCLFVNDSASEQIIRTLSLLGVKMIAMRCAGFDRVDLRAATAYGLTVARVPAYSPYAVAEMAVALLMAVNRKIARASARIKMANFALDAGLMGMDIFGKTVGIMGTGKIGQILCQIMSGFGAKIICFDVFESPDVKAMGATYVTKDEIFAQSDVIFLMMPLLPPTYHTINETTIRQMKKGVLLINTSRGGLVDTKALLKGIREGIVSGVGIDVYEYEQAYFFQDWSAKSIQDEDLLALIGETNVVMTAHQAFFTKEAVTSIIDTTVQNLKYYYDGKTGFFSPEQLLAGASLTKKVKYVSLYTHNDNNDVS
jgi:D-lactate dehydrogenase